MVFGRRHGNPEELMGKKTRKGKRRRFDTTRSHVNPFWYPVLAFCFFDLQRRLAFAHVLTRLLPFATQPLHLILQKWAKNGAALSASWPLNQRDRSINRSQSWTIMRSIDQSTNDHRLGCLTDPTRPSPTGLPQKCAEPTHCVTTSYQPLLKPLNSRLLPVRRAKKILIEKLPNPSPAVCSRLSSPMSDSFGFP
jgi:hypothetical protein